MNFLLRYLLLLGVALTLWGTMGAPAWAAPSPAGTVTQVAGQVTLKRKGLPRLVPIKFRDRVYLHDKIRTGERSFVRVLFGRKALVTVGELSVLTITEDITHASVNLQSGIIGLSVARRRMAPGEFIEVRTPHAVATIRGTKVIAEVPTPDITQFTVVEGHIEIVSTSRPTEIVSLKDRQTLQTSLSGPGTIKMLSPEALAKAQQKLSPPRHLDQHITRPDSPVSKHVVTTQTERALTVVRQLAPKASSSASSQKSPPAVQSSSLPQIVEASPADGSASQPEVSSGPPATSSHSASSQGFSAPVTGVANSSSPVSASPSATPASQPAAPAPQAPAAPAPSIAAPTSTPSAPPPVTSPAPSLPVAPA
ncbi:MAG: hypothetical protein D6704_12610, partial [Nitrospirae bacterium]